MSESQVGFDPNKCNDSGATALHVVCASERPAASTVTMLVRYGAHPNVQDRNGNTPLHFAAEVNNRKPPVYSTTLTQTL